MGACSLWSTLLTLSLLGGIAGDPSPDGALKAAVLDLSESVSPPARIYTRYLALWPIPEADRASFTKSMAFWLNSSSWRPKFGGLAIVQDGQLVRIDLRDFGWDRYSRAERLANAQASGAAFAFKDEATKARFLDVWELIAQKDPYFFASQQAGQYGYTQTTRGWLDPIVEAESRRLTYSSKPILRADWFLTQISLDRPLGFYSDALMLPAKEADLFKILGVDPGFVDRERLKRGGATQVSIVAIHNRELQKFPTLIGLDQAFLWRSLDTKTDVGNQAVIENFVGTIKVDGKELIFSLPNGLHGYYLANGAGDQVGEVPTDIAQDKQDPFDSRVINPYKCVSCHGPSSGINSFDDVVTRIALGANTALATVSKDPEKAEKLRQQVEDYYLTPLKPVMAQQQASYAARVMAVNGLASEKNSAEYVKHINQYRWSRLNLDRAAVELGYPREKAVLLMQASGNPTGLALINGLTVSREAFEANFRKLAEAARYSWEK